MSGTDPSDADLVARFRDGDREAFATLVARHERRVYNLAYRMLGRPEDARDASQEAFISCFRHLDRFRGDSAFGTWLHRVAVNVVIERRRTYAVQRDRISDDPEALDRVTVPAARGDLTVTFEQAIEQLPAGAREIFVLHDVEGYKHREIAVLLDITSGTSKRQLHRARMLLRRQLGAL